MTSTRVYEDVIEVTLSEPGPPGAQGPPGAPGPAGGQYTHSQLDPAEVWDVVHPLAFIPNVLVIDSAGTAVFGDVRILTPNRIQISFSVPFSGSALLS